MDDHDSLVSRMSDMEHQMAMYEKLFQTFSAKLDHHFKKYDMIINSQQQQISALNSVLQMVLNDQHRYAGIIKDKLLDSLAGVTAASPSPSVLAQQQISKEERHQNRDRPYMYMCESGLNQNPGEPLQYSKGVQSMFDNIISPQSLTTTPNHPNNPTFKAFPADITKEFVPDLADNSDALPEARNKHRTARENTEPDTTDFVASQILGKRVFESDPATNAPPRGSSPSLMSESGPVDTSTHVVPSSDKTDIKEESYYTSGGQKRKRKIFAGEFRFLCSPQSVMEVWKEYSEGFAGQPSLKEMELMYQTAWRRDPGMSKKFFRRKALCRAIERGLAAGYSLKEVIEMLETHRKTHCSNGQKQPIGWLCRHSNIPEMFK
ncbi:LAMI_0E04654g1_1 [Lachancea mirantina]|uniref:LAMI_0E04654g1_1 n=1 Tax=Lachancea mirantina TaxID=1230905 RepID=A0A1G4JKP3_9SACH|nr:LAMI_0E04654g1_1 [Lachancea mirantina]